MNPGETILLADDDESVRTFVSHVLRNAGYAVMAARDGAEALQIFQTGNHAVTLAVLDVAMPKLNGRLVAEKIRAIRPDLPVLFCTGYDFRLLEEGFTLESGMDILHKPFTHTDLLLKIRAMIDDCSDFNDR